MSKSEGLLLGEEWLPLRLLALLEEYEEEEDQPPKRLASPPMELLPRGNERNITFCCVSEDKEDNKGKRTPLVVTPALFVEIILVLLNVKEANVIVDTL